MLKKFVSTLLLVPLFSLFMFVGGSYAWGGKDKQPKPEKPAPKASYVISQTDKGSKLPKPEKPAPKASYEVAKAKKGSKLPKPEQPKPESPKATI